MVIKRNPVFYGVQGNQKTGEQMEYKIRLEEIKKKGIKDNNFCTVMSSAIAFNTSFEKMQKIYFDYGRKSCKVKKYMFRPFKCTAENRSFYVDVKNDKNRYYAPRITPNNASDYLPNGNYILGVYRHVLSFKDGIIEDWTKNRKHHVDYIYEILKQDQKRYDPLQELENNFDLDDFDF
jgi:hypothetical protein